MKLKWPRGRNGIVAGIVAAIVALCCCLSVATAVSNMTPSGRETSTARAIAQLTEEATKKTPRPTATDRPSNTPRPTNTVRPTNTKAPTEPPTETKIPTASPEPVSTSGTGDAVIDLESPYQGAIVHITGNSSGRHFAVTNYGAGNERYDLLVNTTDPYDGFRIIDLAGGQHTVRFEITASGDWSIEILSLLTAPLIDVPGTLDGVGDGVFIIRGNPGTATIKGNAGGHHFAVENWNSDGSHDLLVNTTDPYEGTVLLDTDAILFQVTAADEWSVEIKQ